MSIDGRIIMNGKNLSPESSLANYADVGVRAFPVQDYANTYQLDVNTSSPTPYNKILRGGSWGFFYLHPVDWGKTNTATLKPIWYSNFDDGVFWPVLVIPVSENTGRSDISIRYITKQSDSITFYVDENTSYLIFNGVPTSAN